MRNEREPLARVRGTKVADQHGQHGHRCCICAATCVYQDALVMLTGTGKDALGVILEEGAPPRWPTAGLVYGIRVGRGGASPDT